MNEIEVIKKLELYFKMDLELKKFSLNERFHERFQNLGQFIDLFNKLDINKNVDFFKIPNFDKNIDNMLKTSLEISVSSSNFNPFFNILRIGNKFRILKPRNKKKYVIQHIFLENLKALFENIDQDFIDFILHDLPYLTLNLIRTRMGDYLNSRFEVADLKRYVENVFYAYTLRTRKIASFEEYIKLYNEGKRKFDDDFMAMDVKVDFQGDFLNFEMQFIDFDEIHVLDEQIFLNIVDLHQKEKILYDYPIISLVTSGGVGPQGKGFAYLTPMNEVVEICSDLSQNQAYILKFKQFLKTFFLKHLKKKLQAEITSAEATMTLIKFLEKEIQLEIININHYEIIIEKIEEHVKNNNVVLNNKEDFIDYVKQSLLQILAPVKLEDQFKLRMQLIRENKLRLTDVSKLVSLGDVSHYDVLNQREFFIHNLDHLDKINKEV